MSVLESEYFPRGGKKVIHTAGDNKRKHEETLFPLIKPPKAKRSRKQSSLKAKNVNSEDLWQASIKLQGTLTYNRIQDGMIILGCIKHISNLAVQVEFPGLTFATVPINNISDAFTTSLTEALKTKHDFSCTNALRDVVSIGQLVPAKVLSIKSKDKGHDVQASINPKDVNSDKKHSSFKKGALIWANIESELDHGYELTVGVNNCRVFLPFKNIDDSKKYKTGEPLFCIIHKVVTSTYATTLTVSAKKDHIAKPQIKEELNLNDVISGTRVDFFIEEVLPHGLKGQFFDSCYGYIDETQIFSSVKKSKLKEGSTVPAYVLFIEPITKITYLTLRGIENLPGPELTVGQISSSKVLYNVPKGLYLHLGKSGTGFVSNKRLLKTLPKDSHLDIVNAVTKKYPNGSQHDCRILDYNYMQELYICTFEKQIIKEKIFTTNDLEVGQAVVVQIDKIVSNGLVVKAGRVQGFVPNLHLSNVKYTDNIKGKFSIGMTVNARVLNMTDGNVIFTLKQGLVESEKCLAKIEDAKPKSQFVGFVVQTKISGALVAFYGNCRGWISNRVLNSGNKGPYMDPREYFFIGQVVNVWILGTRENRLQVSIHPPKVSLEKTVSKKQVEQKKRQIEEEENGRSEEEEKAVSKKQKKEERKKKQKLAKTVEDTDIIANGQVEKRKRQVEEEIVGNGRSEEEEKAVSKKQEKEERKKQQKLAKTVENTDIIANGQAEKKKRQVEDEILENGKLEDEEKTVSKKEKKKGKKKKQKLIKIVEDIDVLTNSDEDIDERFEENNGCNSENEEIENEFNEDVDSSDESNEEIDENEESDEEDSFNFKTESNTASGIKTESVLSGAQSFYNISEENNSKEESSDEEEQEAVPSKKEKKLTPAERAEIAKKEEARITKIEHELADSTATPQTAEQFDRLLLANPNSSKLWLQYMSMHIASTELEKARAIGKKALETINMTEVKEKYNVWIALLNLENMYGTKESFEKIFEEAVRYNDSLEIYLNVIEMLASSGKLVEMEEKIKKIRQKEKQSTKMWLEIGKIYYSLGKFKEARNIKEAALKSILDKKRQFDLIIKFGIMEFQLGEYIQAVANFETILDTYPNKVNIWTLYVDQLVRKKKIEDARKVLQKATNQKFALKTMKVLFQKFIAFEEQYGTVEAVDEIKNKAKEYVSALRAK